MYLGTEQVRSRHYAEATQRVIDEEVEALLRDGEQHALTLLSGHRDALDRLVAALLTHETLDGQAVDNAVSGPNQPTGPAETGGRVQIGVRTATFRQAAKEG